MNKKIYEKLLELEDEEKIDIDISYRGGHYGLPAKDALELVQEFLPKNPMVVYDNMDYLLARLPRCFGAYCNYLGGGLRGAIGRSDFDNDIYKEFPSIAKKLDELSEACAIRYKEIEQETFEDGIDTGRIEDVISYPGL